MDEELITVQVWLCSYQHPHGWGRFFNHRVDGLAPSVDNIEAMERKISVSIGASNTTIMSVSRLADTEMRKSWLIENGIIKEEDQ